MASAAWARSREPQAMTATAEASHSTRSIITRLPARSFHHDRRAMRGSYRTVGRGRSSLGKAEHREPEDIERHPGLPHILHRRSACEPVDEGDDDSSKQLHRHARTKLQKLEEPSYRLHGCFPPTLERFRNGSS